MRLNRSYLLVVFLLLVFANHFYATTVNSTTSEYKSLVEKWSAYHQIAISSEVIQRLVSFESGWNPGAVSPKGARGLMQIMPETAQILGVKDCFDPNQNIRGGVKYIKWLLDRYNGDMLLALAAYNWGFARADKLVGLQLDAIVKKLPRDTRGLIAFVLKNENPSVALAMLNFKNRKVSSRKANPVATVVAASNMERPHSNFSKRTLVAVDLAHKALYVTLQAGQTVSHIAYSLTGQPENWRHEGIQVINKNGQAVEKTDASYRRLAIGSLVRIDFSLVKGIEIKDVDGGAKAICQEFAVQDCETKANALTTANDSCGLMPGMLTSRQLIVARSSPIVKPVIANLPSYKTAIYTGAVAQEGFCPAASLFIIFILMIKRKSLVLGMPPPS